MECPVRCLSFSFDGSYICAGSDEAVDIEIVSSILSSFVSVCSLIVNDRRMLTQETMYTPFLPDIQYFLLHGIPVDTTLRILEIRPG